MIVVAVRLELGLAEVRSLQQEAAILRADVEAGAQLIRHAAAEQGTDVGVLPGIQLVRSVVAGSA